MNILFFVFVLCVFAPTHEAATAPRRGAKRAAFVVVPGLNDAAWSAMVATNPKLERLSSMAFLKTEPKSAGFEHEHAMGLELATGCPFDFANGRDTVARGARRQRGL